jgi:prepilin peptidase CpaA
MEYSILIILAVVLLTAIYTDLISSRIPNLLTLSTMGVAPIAHGYLAGFQGVLFSMEGLGAGLGLFLLLYASGGIGAGDVKLMGAVGALVGPYGALVSAVLALLVGGVYALGAMCYQWGVTDTGRKLFCATLGIILPGRKARTQDLNLPFSLRYGLAIVGGTLLFLGGFHPFGG